MFLNQLRAVFIAFIGFAGCNFVPGTALQSPQTPNATSLCALGTVQFTVGDTSLTRVCGCQESNNTTVTTGQGNLSCTAKVGTKVIFNYADAANPHQVIVSPYNTGPVVAPHAHIQVKPFQVQIAYPGTYPFYDSFTPSLAGTLMLH